MLIILLLLTLGVSFWNAKVCGEAWVESKAVGGWIRLVVWCGAIMAAIGFTEVIAIVLILGAAGMNLLPTEAVKAAFSLVYVLIVPPVIGAGVIITIHSWIAWWREKSLLNLGVAGWNTFCDAYNMYHAVNNYGPALDNAFSYFSGVFDSDSDSDSDDAKAKLALLLVAIAVLGGIITTMTIIRKYAGTLPVRERDALAKAQ